MLNFLLSTLNSLLHNPAWVYTFLFFDALLTTVPVLGTMVLETPVAVVAGALASQGYFSLPVAMLAGMLGGVIGDGLGYHLGRRVGLRLVNTPWIASHGRFESAHTFFERHGGKSIIGARFIGPLRTVIPLIAGIVRMPVATFWLYNISSAIVWGLIFFPLGFYFGTYWKQIVSAAENGGIFVFVIITVMVIIWYRRRSSTSREEEKNV